ncbi:LOW QUALITY PROTEIN: hypothetical protein QYF61_017977 [Mycteria americana]|uniref:Uncharacterized protein n=1 Tax=Mycteria americana TaxID=33587 RepID=A0AAN7RTL3_MYCAM|nr:LOW QUALITY PROTEIN: hypothetical protein QYF61_017977 [Mycteria americana]
MENNQLRNSSAEKALMVLVAPTRANILLGCIRQSIASRSREMILPFFSALYKRDMGITEGVQWRAAEIIKGLDHLSYQERLTELGLFSLEESHGGSYLLELKREQLEYLDIGVFIERNEVVGYTQIHVGTHEHIHTCRHCSNKVQGSLLGPILFNIFIHNIHNEAKLIGAADSFEDTIQKDLDRLSGGPMPSTRSCTWVVAIPNIIQTGG